LFLCASLDAKEAGTDNRNILDDGKSQKLTRDDIETLKEQGLKGQVPLDICGLVVTSRKWRSWTDVVTRGLRL
jgi:hypothetical protein